MATLAGILLLIVNVAFWIVIAHVVMSWLLQFEVLNLRQPVVAQVWAGLERLLRPVYAKIGRYLPDTRPLDLAPLVVFIILLALRIFLTDIRYGVLFG